MDINIVRAFFMWCTIINGGMLIISSLIMMCAGDRVFHLHSKWFPMSREAFNVSIYSMLGFFKIVVFTFNLVPYLALAIAA